jgi:hypothetical protein
MLKPRHSYIFTMVLVSLLLTSVAAFAAQPKAAAKPMSYDFGTIYQGEEVVTTFVIRNDGDDTLVIDKVKSSCGCTAASPGKMKLAPKETTDLKVTFKSAGMHDRVVKHVYIDSNDPTQPRLTVTIEGIVKQEVNLNPKGIYLGNIEKDEQVVRTVEITSAESKTFRILDVTSDTPLVKVKEPERLAAPKVGYKLTVLVGPLEADQRVNGKILVRTDLPRTKEVQIQVYGRTRTTPSASIPRTKSVKPSK